MNKLLNKFIELLPIVPCQEATRLISESMERKLSLKERIALWLHLRLCEFCIRFLKQIHGLRKIARGYKLQDVQLSQTAKDQIKQAIKDIKN
jgi:hypothetical protein